MNIKIYAICLMTLLSGLLQASAPAASASSSSASAPALTPEQEQKNKALDTVLSLPDSDETATEITRLLNEGARCAVHSDLFDERFLYRCPIYFNNPKKMHALINHPSTIKEGGLWHNLQATFIRSPIGVLKELIKNHKFDINYNDKGQNIVRQRINPFDVDNECERILFLCFMGRWQMGECIKYTKRTLALFQRQLAEDSREMISMFANKHNEYEKVLRILEMPQHEIPTLLTPEQHQEYALILLQRERAGQNLLTYVTNRQMHPSFAKHQKAAQRRAQSLAAAVQNEAPAAQNQGKKSHTIATDDAERPSKKQKKDEEEKNN